MRNKIISLMILSLFLISIASADLFSDLPSDDVKVENLEVADVNQNSNNLSIGSRFTDRFDRSYLKFDISPINQEGYTTSVQEAKIYLYFFGNDYGGYENLDEVNISVYEVYSDNLNESTITWNNQICGTNFNNSEFCNLTKIDYINFPVPFASGWYSWDVTETLSKNIGNQTATFIFRVEDDTIPSICGALGSHRCAVFIYDKENSETNYPYINITYTLTPIPPSAQQTEIYQTLESSGAGLGRFVENTTIPLASFFVVLGFVAVIVIVLFSLSKLFKQMIEYSKR